MNLFDRAKNILITPKTEWEVIKNEQTTIAEMFTGYAMILALIPAVSSFIGQTFVGMSLGPFGSYKLSLGAGLLYGVVQYILTLVGIYVVAFIVDALAPNFGAAKDMVASVKVVVYSWTAAWVVGIFGLIPIMGILMILGLYSFYLLYLGLQIIKAPPPEKLATYFIVIIVVTIVVYVVIGAVVSAVAMPSLGDLQNFDLKFD